MARLAEVGRGMPVGAGVAAARPPARQALAQVDPCGIDLDARRADIERRVDLKVRLEMFAGPRQAAGSPMRPRPGQKRLAGAPVATTLPSLSASRRSRPRL